MGEPFCYSASGDARVGLVASLANLRHGQSADFFAQLYRKENCLTRQGRPFTKAVFRDRFREVTATIWEGSPLEQACRDDWQIGRFYKIRAVFQESIHGPRIEIQRLRDVEPADSEAGFDPLQCQPGSRHDSGELFDTLLDLIDREIPLQPLNQLVTEIYQQNRARLEEMPGALHHHHAYAGGFLEHVYSVTKNVLYLLETYRGQHLSLADPLTRQLAVAGGLLHDIGKLAELDGEVAHTAYTVPGELVGHIVLGRDIVRDMARDLQIDEPWLLRLEHLILSHQGKFENGSPKLPMTWESNLVYWADELDGNMFRLAQAVEQGDSSEPFAPRTNGFGRKVYRGESPVLLESSE